MGLWLCLIGPLCVQRAGLASGSVLGRKLYKDTMGCDPLSTHLSICPSVALSDLCQCCFIFLSPVSSIMLVRALLQTSLVLWLVQQTLQGGVKPQSVSWGRVLPARGVGVKPGGTGALGALGSRYGTKAMKTGIGRYPGAQLGVGGYRALGLGGRAGLRQGGYGAQVPYGANLGTGLPLGTGLGNGLGLGQGGKRVYGAGLGTLPGYGALGGIGYPGARPGYFGGAGNYLGASLGPGAYGPGLGQGVYLGGAAGKLGAPAALGQGYGEGTTGYLGAVAGNGFGGDAGAKALSTGYGNGYGDGYGAGLGYPAELADGGESKAGKREALGTGGYAGQVQGAYGGLGTGLESTGGKYGGGAAQVPYGNAPVIPTGLEGAGPGYGAQQAGYGAQLGATQDALGEHAGKYGGMNGALGNGYKG